MSTIVRSVRRKKYTPPTKTTTPIAALTSSAGTLGGLVPRSDQRKALDHCSERVQREQPAEVRRG